MELQKHTLSSRQISVVLASAVLTLAGCGFSDQPDHEPQSSDDSPKLSEADRKDDDRIVNAETPNELRLRPGVDHLRIAESKADTYVTLDDEKGPAGVPKYAYVRGPVRHEISELDAGDVFYTKQLSFIYILGPERKETDRGLRVGLRKFLLMHVIWGEFEIEMPIEPHVDSHRDGQTPTVDPDRETIFDAPSDDPRFRTRAQPAFVLEPKLAWGKLGASVRFQGGIDVNPRFEVDPTFHGKIGPLEHNAECDPPVADFKICVPGGFWCAGFEFCIDKVGVTTTAGVVIATSDQPQARLRVRGGVEIINKDLANVSWPQFDPNLPIPGLPGVSLSVIPEFEANASFSVTGGWNAPLDFQITALKKFGVMYEQGRGAYGIWEDPDCSGGCPQTAWNSPTEFSDGRLQGEAFVRLSGQVGLDWGIGTGLPGPNGLAPRGRTSLFDTAIELKHDTAARTWPYNPSNAPKSCLQSKITLNPLVQVDIAQEVIWGGQRYEIWDPSFGSFSWRGDTSNGLQAVLWDWYSAGTFCPQNDSDNDGCPDANDPAPNDPDGDGDGCTCGQERGLGLDPTKADTDDDGVSDGLQCQNTGPPGPGSGAEKPFKVEAAWRTQTDVDLHVIGPDGAELGPDNRKSDSSDAEYLFDICGDDGQCSDSGTNTETVAYPRDVARGQYELWVTNDDGGSPTTVRLRARRGEMTTFYKEIRLGGSQGTSSQHFHAAY